MHLSCTLKMSRFGGLANVFQGRFGVTCQSTAEEHGTKLVAALGLEQASETSWDTMVGMFFDLRRARVLMLRGFYMRLAFVPTASAEDGIESMWHMVMGLGTMMPQIGGCLSSIIRMFVKDQLGDGIVFLRDLVQAASGDVAGALQASQPKVDQRLSD